jgi:hypothetical protein
MLEIQGYSVKNKTKPLKISNHVIQVRVHISQVNLPEANHFAGP